MVCLMLDLPRYAKNIIYQALLTSMSWYFDFNRWDIWSTDRTSKRNVDNEESREKIKMIHMSAEKTVSKILILHLKISVG
jgi:hypothetical protein